MVKQFAALAVDSAIALPTIRPQADYSAAKFRQSCQILDRFQKPARKKQLALVSIETNKYTAIRVPADLRLANQEHSDDTLSASLGHDPRALASRPARRLHARLRQ
jgi:hypothetical protein